MKQALAIQVNLFNKEVDEAKYVHKNTNEKIENQISKSVDMLQGISYEYSLGKALN